MFIICRVFIMHSLKGHMNGIHLNILKADRPCNPSIIHIQTGMSWLTGYANHSRHLVHMVLTIV